MKKTISFDLWNTLIISNPKFQEARIEMIRNYSDLSRDEIILRLKLFKIDIDSTCEKFGIQTPYLTTMKMLYDLLEIKSNKLALKPFIDKYKRVFETYPPKLIDGVYDMLEELHKKYNLVITSNTVLIPGIILRDILNNLNIGHFFTDMIFSNEQNVCKPHPQMFHATQMAASGSLKCNIVHVGDNRITDIDGAMAYGFNTVHIINHDLSTVIQRIEAHFNNKHQKYLLNNNILD